MSSTNTTTKSTSKSAKKSRIVTLRLPSSALAQFPSDVKPTSSAPVKPDPSPSVQPAESTEKTSESNSTPLPSTANDGNASNSLAPPKVDRRRRGGGTVTGRKRAPPSIDPNAPPRERARPGPKRRRGVGANGATDNPDSKQGPSTAANGVSSHKLGPKANTGAINAGLRALDRTGKPCRRWDRKSLNIKSFTGAYWNVGSWKAPTRDSAFSGDVQSDSISSSDIKPNGSSALPSEQSNSGNGYGDTVMTNGIDSSPAPPVAS